MELPHELIECSSFELEPHIHGIAGLPISTSNHDLRAGAPGRVRHVDEYSKAAEAAFVESELASICS